MNTQGYKLPENEAKYTGHHPKHAALQAHSCGDVYPWTVKIVKGAGGYAQSVQCVTGEQGPKFPIEHVEGSFKLAHNAAESFARRQLEKQQQ